MARRLWFKTAIVVLSALLLTAAAPGPDRLTGQVRAWRAAHEGAIVGQLDALVRIPSVAAQPAGIAAAADTLIGLLKDRGFATRLLTAGPGVSPVVYGELKTPGARRTVVFYAHYDGQPVVPSQWKTPAFEPVMRAGTLEAPEVDWKAATGPMNPEWRLFGRAASDDKASIVAFLAAFDALQAAHRKPSVNIKVVWEGEEEAGSPHLEAILRANQPLLAADLWLIGDGPVHQSRRPSLYFGARGSLGLEAMVYGPIRPLHDGHYGNWVPNPAAMAAELISQLRDGDGHILIPGFSDPVRPLTPAEHAALDTLPNVEDGLKAQFAIGRAESGERLADSLMRPALNIRGIRAGGVAAEANNAIPTEAAVSIDFRLVPDQTPAGIKAAVEAYLASKGWTVVHSPPDAATRTAHPKVIYLAWDAGYPGLRTLMSDPVSMAVIAAGGRTFGQPIVTLPMMGGSVPIYLFKDIFGAPIIGLPIVNHDNSQHAPNENLRLQNLWDGIELYAHMLGDLRW
jgi:acetylornithine deacetylase/succinyl-diaminopimelate desuccinylase-like protein